MSCNCGQNTPKPNIFNVVGIGRLERRNPVPPGIYWTDLIGPENIQIFAEWVLAHPIFVAVVRS